MEGEEGERNKEIPLPEQPLKVQAETSEEAGDRRGYGTQP